MVDVDVDVCPAACRDYLAVARAYNVLDFEVDGAARRADRFGQDVIRGRIVVQPQYFVVHAALRVVDSFGVGVVDSETVIAYYGVVVQIRTVFP